MRDVQEGMGDEAQLLRTCICQALSSLSPCGEGGIIHKLERRKLMLGEMKARLLGQSASR